MLITLAEARSKLGKYVDAGSCSPTTIDSRLNEALERIMDSDELTINQRFARICVCNRCFALPYNAEKILFADIDGTPANIHGYVYQFLSSGPGDLDYRNGGGCYKDLVIKDYSSPVMYDIPCEFENDGTEYGYPEGLHLVAFSTAIPDASLTIRVQGRGEGNREVNPGSYPGEEVPIHRWRGGVLGTISGIWNDQDLSVSETAFTSVTRVILPETTAPIYLYAVDNANNFFFFLGEYRPGILIPQFTRYSVTNHAIGTRANILVLLKMRHITLSQPTDILPIDSLHALKTMLIAIRQENAGDLAGALSYENKARTLMGDREKSRTNTGGLPVILNRNYRTSLGRYMNRGGRIL